MDFIKLKVEASPVKIIITTDNPTTFWGVISGIIPKFNPTNNVAGTNIMPPPSPTSAPTKPENSAIMTKRKKFHYSSPSNIFNCLGASPTSLMSKIPCSSFAFLAACNPELLLNNT